MKKFKFSKLNLDDAHILSREELKYVLGGDGYGGTCAYYMPNGGYGGTPVVTYNVSSSEAQQMIQGISGAHWCCDSCGSASWYGI